MSESPYQYPQPKILTQRGLISIDDVIINSDCVYDYTGTNKLLPIRDIKIIQSAKIYEVTFTDGRKEMYTDQDLLPSKGIIKQISLEYNQGRVMKPLYPDPYTAGALFGYGYYENSEIELPITKQPVKDMLSHKYNVGNNGIVLTWEDFFEDYEFYAKNKNPKDPLFPYDYEYSSTFNRLQFIRGVFDTGYSPTDFPDVAGISHWDVERLKHIQKILWSLGVLSKIYYGPPKDDIPSARWSLEIIGKYKYYPGFFYSIEGICKMIDAHHKIYLEPPTECVYVKEIKEIPELAGSYTQHIILDSRELVYVSENYLPRFSI